MTRKPLVAALAAALALATCGLSAPARADDEGREDLDQATTLQLSARNLRDLKKVAELCESALKKGLNPEDQEFARQLLSSSMLQHAEQLSGGVLSIPPRSQWRLLRLLALQSLDKAVEYSPKMGDAYMLKAKLLVLPEGDRKQAEEAVTKAVDAFDNDKLKQAEALILRAQISQKEEQQLADLKKAIELAPQRGESWQALATYHFERGELEKAVESFRKQIEVDPDNIVARLALAETIASMDKADEALKEVDKVLEERPDSATAYRLKAQIYVARDELKEASQALDKAVELEPDDFRTLLFRSEVRLALDDLKGAREDVDNVLSERPGLVAGILLRARVRAASKNVAGAIRDLTLVLENTPDPPAEWKLQLAAYLSLDQRPRKGIEVITEVIDEDPENAYALRSRADALLSIGKHKEAIADFEKALQLDADDSGLLNNLAWVLATSPDDELRDGQRAIELATKACELTEYKEAHILSTLASGYAEMGDFETARKWSAKAVELGEGEMKEQLEQELESYKKEKPWRERQDVKEKPDAAAGLLET